MICSKTMNTMHRFSHIILKTILIPRATHSPRQHWRRRVEQRLGVRLAAGKPLRQKPSPLEDRRQLPLAENPPASVLLPYDADAETKAFVEDITKTWDQRRKGSTAMEKREGNSLYSLESIKRDYRLKKQRIHAGLWVKEIDWQEEDKLGNSIGGGGDDIERLLDSYSEIFDSSNDDLNNSKIPRTSEFKNKPDGWETTTKAQDGIVWEMSQRAEDILLQEYER